jgi:C2 domain
MWRQIELQVMQGRHIRTQRATANGYDAGENIAESDFDGELSCEIHLNNILCGRTTGKQRAPNNVMVDWHERFLFPDLPPFETLDIKVWKEKKSSRPYPLGLVQIQLHHFRRGEATEGWFPIIHGVSGPAREMQIGEIRLSIRVEEYVRVFRFPGSFLISVEEKSSPQRLRTRDWNR